MPPIPSFRNTARPPRLVSMEQEFSRNGRAVADALALDWHGYHSHRRGGRRDIWIEDDSSCAGELIYGCFDLAEETDARRFREVVETVDETRAAGRCHVGYSSGLHVHVDMTGEAFATLRSLYLVFNHLEDCLYRLASAGYRMHRDDHTGSGYASPPRKGLRRAVEIQNHFSRGRGGLNLSPYIGAMLSCQCGAVRLDWSECTCAARDASTGRTVEFRLWNGTTRPQKLAAYVALSHALVEYASTHPNVKPERLPERPYNSARADGQKLRASLRFILDRLPLSTEERTAILWTARRSTIADAVGEAFLSECDLQYGNATALDATPFEDDASPEMEMATATVGSDEDDDYNDDDDRDRW